MPFSPFVVYGPGIGEDRKEGQLWRFCEYLTDKAFNFTIHEGSGNPAANVVPGVCELWEFPGYYATFLKDYPIVFGLAFDYNGCSSATDKHRNGINMPDYGTSDCYHAFESLLVEKCIFTNDVMAQMKMGKYPVIGGMLFKDCMRWTVMAPRHDLAPPPLH
ncbi:hypothetical protein G647_01109 [Cladophialophora carrionii CBS 160.54]|uniref:Uncharacterized protein n=1 Tax=Cladophialophora carrionii CBS 160.54 TaxID=1279043 RepID=V9DQR8_9EURO|nr:uncharacterized protein G647_01109 [Cladophialophora carrionii CBS 160.54]ETI28658.1 hypothetical protein G647_01109 [Cladophialophora carrionii CBS 160.54]